MTMSLAAPSGVPVPAPGYPTPNDPSYPPQYPQYPQYPQGPCQYPAPVDPRMLVAAATSAAKLFHDASDKFGFDAVQGATLVRNGASMLDAASPNFRAMTDQFRADVDEFFGPHGDASEQVSRLRADAATGAEFADQLVAQYRQASQPVLG